MSGFGKSQSRPYKQQRIVVRVYNYLHAASLVKVATGLVCASFQPIGLEVIVVTTFRTINKVAVIGSGTMGMGIAALCAQAGYQTVLLDVKKELADAAVERMLQGRNPALEDAEKKSLIDTGSLDDLDKIADADWICEAIIENLEIKRDLFSKLEKARKDGSIISSNTSGIPLRSITEGMPQRLCQDIAVTHFFNPVKVMRLLELVPGESTGDDVIATVDRFAKHVEHASAHAGTDRHRDWGPGAAGRHAATQSVGGRHRHAADHVVSEVLGDFQDQRVLVFAGDFDRVVDGRKIAGEGDVDDRAEDLLDGAGCAHGTEVCCGATGLPRRTRSR